MKRPGMRRPDREWVGRRWFEMRTGYATYLAFGFGFGNFVLILHGLTGWFRDYPLHWFAVALIAVIIPAAILIGHRHNRTQLKTERRNLTRLNPYIDLIVPNSKEELGVRVLLAQALWCSEMAKKASDPRLAGRFEKAGRVCTRLMNGEASTEALRKEGL